MNGENINNNHNDNKNENKINDNDNNDINNDNSELNKIFNSNFDKNIIEKKYGEYLQKLYEKTLEIERNKISQTEKDLKRKEYLKKYQIIDIDNIFKNDRTELEINKIKNNLKNKNEKYNKNNIKIKKILTLSKISFEIEYKTHPGEEIGICGEGQEFLGNWDKDKCFKLKCFNEKIWKGTIKLNNLNDFEFKFVLKSNNNFKWQDGDNNKVIFQDLYQEVLKNHKGKNNNYEYEYINDELILKCKW